jgi:hypothetical protein
MRVEEALADADHLGRDLDQLVVLDVGDRLLEAHAARRGEADAFVLGAGRAEVGGGLRCSLNLYELGIESQRDG